RRMVEAVEPVAPEREEDAIVEERSDVAVALPHARQVEVDRQELLRLRTGLRVLVRQEARDDLARLEAEVLALHFLAAVLEEAEADRALGEDEVQVGVVRPRRE